MINTQPKLGDSCHGFDLGKNNRGIYVWGECPKCHEQRWINKHKSKTRTHTGVCSKCKNKRYGSDNPKWQGGRFNAYNGYILCLLRPDDFFYPMTNKYGHVLEHRLIMAKSLGRNLHPWEIVHHINHIKNDNRTDNLQLVSGDKHTQITIMERQIRRLSAKVVQLEAENILLKAPQNPTLKASIIPSTIPRFYPCSFPRLDIRKDYFPI